MEPAWGASWGYGLSLIMVTTAVHALGVVMIYRGLQRSGRLAKNGERHVRHPTLLAVTVIAVIALLLAVLHGVESGIWAIVYLWLGAMGSQSDAMLYSVDSFTTRGAPGLLLSAEWRLMGALESANGMLLFGISTAFLFAVIQRIMTIVDQSEVSDC